ncbi:hypothetical protein [Paenibacillus polymyxa]|uniref:hypothetical protein n=1 Tax=Paenibacillus polymyxa TaxID=1406 RepID=UPI0004218BA6|nr:hypothetical protein [Paenibacillus polymyxa]
MTITVHTFIRYVKHVYLVKGQTTELKFASEREKGAGEDQFRLHEGIRGRLQCLNNQHLYQ